MGVSPVHLRLEPLSIWLIAVYGLAIFFGGAYLGRFSGNFSGDGLDPLGGAPRPKKLGPNGPGEQTAELSQADHHHRGGRVVPMARSPVAALDLGGRQIEAGCSISWAHGRVIPSSSPIETDTPFSALPARPPSVRAEAALSKTRMSG